MKNYLIYFITLITFLSQAQENDAWRIGAQWGFQGNNANLIGGQNVADSRFENHNAGGIGLNIFTRYDYNNHWMLLTGLGLGSYGFEFSLAQNYSLLNPDSRRAVLKNDIGLLELPLMIHYKFNPNCKQSKWVIGIGFTQNLQTGSSASGTYKEGNEATSNISNFNSEVKLKNTFFPTLRFSVGREKRFDYGGLLNFNFLLNLGFSESAKANVKYTIDGKTYEHQFNNQGSFFGFRMAYYFAPFKQSTLK